jgi:hypothetical protein
VLDNRWLEEGNRLDTVDTSPKRIVKGTGPIFTYLPHVRAEQSNGLISTATVISRQDFAFSNFAKLDQRLRHVPGLKIQRTRGTAPEDYFCLSMATALSAVKLIAGDFGIRQRNATRRSGHLDSEKVIQYLRIPLNDENASYAGQPRRYAANLHCCGVLSDFRA